MEPTFANLMDIFTNWYVVVPCLIALAVDRLRLAEVNLFHNRLDADAALVAMVQIVNAHVAQGNTERARTANERARRFFEQLPDTVWDDPTLPMGRDDWERWLDSSSRLYALDRAE